MNEKKDCFDQTQYLTFHLAGEEYAVGILQVKEIITYGTLTKVPHTPASIRGVINLRGNVVPVVDLGVKFGMAASPVTDRTCIVIVEAISTTRRRSWGSLRTQSARSSACPATTSYWRRRLAPACASIFCAAWENRAISSYWSWTSTKSSAPTISRLWRQVSMLWSQLRKQDCKITQKTSWLTRKTSLKTVMSNMIQQEHCV